MNDLIFAENRFGLGPRSGQSPGRSDGRGWAEAQVGQRLAGLPGIPTRADAAAALLAYREERQNARQGQAAMQPAAMPTGGTMTITPAAEAKAPRPHELQMARREQRELYLRLVDARIGAALTTEQPFLERLAHFWANHFAVGATKATTIGYAGLLEMEAIRPHLTGRFADMLMAVERHPAMLLYLDQAQSVGPNSVAGQRAGQRGRDVGLNENLAREILELHTLGVRTGYAQADVTEFARALTGWTIAGLGRGRAIDGAEGDFTFAAMLHEPGSRTILGKRYGEGGEEQGRAVLMDLAVHPATARHVATKLARHFAADDPPPAMVTRLEQAFLKSGGDLPTVYRALLASPEAWDAASPKFRNPWEWSVASLRALGVERSPGQRAVGMLQELGMPVWRPTSPAGFDDVAASWAAPDALMRRVEAAQRMAGAVSGLDARVVAPRVLGARLTPATATAISRAESPATGLALMLVSPEFLRR
ncbi:DUF1800 family protein [Sphingomonas rosea]|uniref:DUF1800 family protein n=1 Tax=Sphingomonas rosea TaxID=335605 RepID=A0ABP7U2T7_9SPHN